MNKLTIIYKDRSQKQEPAIWEDMNSAMIHAEFLLKHVKSIHTIRINPLNGAAPVNVLREEKN